MEKHSENKKKRKKMRSEKEKTRDRSQKKRERCIAKVLELVQGNISIGSMESDAIIDVFPSNSVSCLLTFFIASCEAQNVQLLIGANVAIFPFVSWAFCVIFKE